MNTTRQSKPAARPLSPHLQIYRWQLTMLTSILHRMAGAALAVGLVVFSWMLIAAACGPEAWGLFTAFAGHWAGRLMLFGWTVALFYHLCNGIRHLVWDSGRLFKLKHAYAGGYMVFAGTIVLTVLTWWIVCPWAQGGAAP